ncbi:MAG: chemotaxis protein CheR, partial [Methanomicrobiales archaeon HGW-Methanomicrobiales-4]
MKSSFSSEELMKISRFVNEHIGFSYASDRMSDLSRGYISACQDLGEQSPVSCLKMLDDPAFSRRLEEMLVKKLTIGETYFFRDRNLFSQLRDELLPDLIRMRRLGRKYLRIWSAACSTGEEAYSIAILLRYLIPDISDWEITILATDINPGSLHAAERGVFSKWSFREQSPVPYDNYLSPAPDGRFQISEDIRKMIRFSKLNLITDNYPSDLTGTTTMDIILCRNVLMYFSSDMAALVVDRLNTVLIDKGWLIVSPQEISYAQRPGFIQMKRSSVFLFLKGDSNEEKAIKANTFSEYSLKSDKFQEIIPDEMRDEEQEITLKPFLSPVYPEQIPVLPYISPSAL